MRLCVYVYDTPNKGCLSIKDQLYGPYNTILSLKEDNSITEKSTGPKVSVIQKFQCTWYRVCKPATNAITLILNL